MPIAKIQLPDGRIARFEVPEGTTQDEVMAFAQQQFSRPQNTPPVKPVAVEGWQAERSLPSAAAEAVGNIPGSAVNLAKGVYDVVTNPGQTLDTINKVLGGYLAKGAEAANIPGITAAPDSGQNIAYADMVTQEMKNRYGGQQELLNTIATDPVGFAADLSALLGTGGAALRGGAKLAGESGRLAGKVGSVLSETGAVIDPIAAGLKGGAELAGAVTGTGKASRGLLGVTTGAGSKSIERAVEGSPEFKAALKGQITQSDIVNVADSALSEFKRRRGMKYTQQLDDVMNQVDVLPDGTVAVKQLDITPVRQSFDDMLSRFNVQRAPDGSLDFARSTIDLDPKAVQIVQDIENKLSSWGQGPGDLTPKGVDILKRTLDSVFSETDASRAIVADVRNKVREVLAKDVPGYAEMTKDYQQATDFIHELERTLSLKGGTADTKMRKLNQAVKDNFEARGQLLDAVDSELGTSLVDMIAGNQMSSWMAKNMVGRFAGMAAAGFAVGNGISKEVVAALLFSSPKAVGTVLSTLGVPKSAAKRFIRQRPALQAQFNAITKALEQGTGKAVKAVTPAIVGGVRANQAKSKYDNLIQQELGAQ